MNLAAALFSSFRDRADAGQQLAEQLAEYAHRDDVVVLALPRGGVPVAVEVARRLATPMDVILVRKIGFPGHPEYGIGALSEHDVTVIDHHRLEQLGATTAQLQDTIHDEQVELERRQQTYRQGRNLPDLSGKTVLLIDDGVATGVTMQAAVECVRQLGPAKIVIAVPVCAADTAATWRQTADELVCLLEPANLRAVGQFYRQFDQVSDEQVVELLRQPLSDITNG